MVEQETQYLTRKRARSIGVPPTDPAIDHAIYAELLSETDVCLSKVNKFLEENGILDADVPQHGTHVREIENRLFLDVFATSLLPFDFHLTSAGTWKFYSGAQKHYGAVYDKTTQVSRRAIVLTLLSGED